jgi:dienelactone hydrolase
MLLDVNAAVDWLLDQPGIDKNRVGIIGASVGANIVLRYAAVNDELAAIVALSPGLVYRGVRTDDVIGKIANRPLRLLVAQDDPFAFESCRRLMEIRKGLEERSSQTEMKACAGNLHGTDLVRGVKGLSEWLAEWLRQTLSTAPPVVGK